MTTPEVQMFSDAMDCGGTYVAFCVLVMVGYCIALLAVLFGLLAVRGIWRWLARHTWASVILSAQRKALR